MVIKALMDLVQRSLEMLEFFFRMAEKRKDFDMSSYFDKIKKSLSMSTTLPVGSAGGGMFMMGSAHTHEHKADGSCCGHDHSHDHSHGHAHKHGHHHHHHDGACCEHDHDEGDTTNPKGGCC
jgi:ABC-type Zn2+ transport system substrate-binding protein/surface adhesin